MTVGTTWGSKQWDMILKQIGDGEIPGRNLRAWLKSKGRRMSDPAFYFMMAKMEDAGLVDGFDVPKFIDGVEIRQRTYRRKP